MKVVLFCGGLGLRLRDHFEKVPKPLVQIGSRPILWHLMNYYSHYGHTDFVLCLGYRGDAIKDYFLNYRETLSNDFVLSKGGREITLLGSDIDNWTITFVDTGLRSTIGERLKAAQPHLEGEEVFLANYSDGLTDLPLDRYVENFRARQRIGCFLSVRPTSVFHMVEAGSDDLVRELRSIQDSDLRINGGFFAFRHEIFDHIRAGEELVVEPFQRLIEANELLAYPYDGFWQCMDTFKDRQALEEMASRDDAPWQVWKQKR
jgi:glucose-1-phosphate cytidylyltransferase